MIDFSKVNLRTWSMLGERRTFGLILNIIAAEYDNVFALSGDLASSSGLDRFSIHHKDRFLSAGIAEQNMVSIASGLSVNGFVPFISSFSPFITGRCYDQIRMNCGYMHNNIKLVGLAAGISIGIQGNSHYGLDDVALMNVIPGMTIIEPCDCAEVAKAVEAAYHYNGPVYLRLIGESGTPIVNKADYAFNIGKAIEIKEGKDVTIISSGTMVHQSIKTSEILSQQGIECRIINMHTIKPIDVQIINSIDTPLTVIVQESNVVGGLGSIIGCYMAEHNITSKILILGINDCFPTAGSYKYMLSQTGLDAEHIADSIMKKLNE